MNIKTTKQEVRKTIREEYLKHLIEMEEEDMGREGAERLHKVAFQIASQLAKQVDTASMETRVPAEKLLIAVVDQVKLQMKRK